MLAHKLTPILNVSDIQQSFAWFEKLGWHKEWAWGSPPTFDFPTVNGGELGGAWLVNTPQHDCAHQLSIPAILSLDSTPQDQPTSQPPCHHSHPEFGNALDSPEVSHFDRGKSATRTSISISSKPTRNCFSPLRKK
jgi:hypothetical protein